MQNMDLTEAIDKKVGEVRFDSIDLSFGEIVSLHQNNELVIQPEYQRLFRWSLEQRSRLVESILLELPIPQIFVIENENGALELIDGLQRVSSIFHFMSPDKLELTPLRLEGCELVPELNGKLFDDMPLKLRLQLKRSSVRTVIIKRQSKSFLRYEMFKRLNTGGSALSHQEVRNCSSRMAGTEGANFYEFIQKCAQLKAFKSTTSSMSESEFDQRGDEELVLRFFALKNFRSNFRGNVRDWLDSYMEHIIFGASRFDFDKELQVFSAIFSFIEELFGPSAFVKYRSGQPIGSLAPAYFEAVTMGILEEFAVAQNKPQTSIRAAIIKTLESSAFKSFTGPGANSKPKMAGRIRVVREAVEAA